MYGGRVRVRCAPFSVTKGGRKRSSNGWWGCLSREFSARIHWPVLRPGLIPNKNMRDIFAGQTRTSARAPRSHAGRKKGTKAPDALVRRCATRVLLSDRARAKYSPQWIVAGGRAAFCLRLDTAALLIASPRSPATDDGNERWAIATANPFRFRVPARLLGDEWNGVWWNYGNGLADLPSFFPRSATVLSNLSKKFLIWCLFRNILERSTIVILLLCLISPVGDKYGTKRRQGFDDWLFAIA